MEEMKMRFDQLVERISASKDPEKMKILACADAWGFSQMAATQPKVAQKWLDKLEAIEWYNYLSKAEAEEIVAGLQNQNGSRGGKWSFDAFTQVVESFGGKSEDVPFYNCYALWAVMNMLYSDHAKSAKMFVPEEELPRYFYLMAVEKLKDPDRPHFVRPYFEV